MKTSVIGVHDMLSVLSVAGVEKRISEVPGVESVTVNFDAETATVRYDETRLQATDIKAAVHHSANESAGEPPPKAVNEHKRLVRPLQYITGGPVRILNKNDTVHRPAKQRFDCSLLLIWIPI